LSGKKKCDRLRVREPDWTKENLAAASRDDNKSTKDHSKQLIVLAISSEGIGGIGEPGVFHRIGITFMMNGL
jgi:hypothetical protein